VDGNFFALLSVASIVLWCEKGRKSFLLAAGALAGAVTCIFQQEGLLLFCAILVWLWMQRRENPASRYLLALFSAGYFIVIGLMLAYFLSQGALGSLVYTNVVWPFQHYESGNAVPYAHGIVQDWNQWAKAGGSYGWTAVVGSILIVPYLFVAALPFLLAGLAIAYKERTVKPEILLFWLCGGALLLSEMHRMSIVHLAFGSPLLVILSVYLLGKAGNRLGEYTLQILAITAVCLAFFNFFLVLRADPVATRVGTVAMFGQDTVLKVLDENVSPGEELLVYPYCPTYYFLSNTTNPTRYSGLYNDKTVSKFEEVVSLLDLHKVKHVLWDTNFVKVVIPENFPGAPRVTPGSLLLETYLESHYRIIAEVDGFRVMERIGESPLTTGSTQGPGPTHLQ